MNVVIDTALTGSLWYFSTGRVGGVCFTLLAVPCAVAACTATSRPKDSRIPVRCRFTSRGRMDHDADNVVSPFGAVGGESLVWSVHVDFKGRS